MLNYEEGEQGKAWEGEGKREIIEKTGMEDNCDITISREHLKTRKGNATETKESRECVRL